MKAKVVEVESEAFDLQERYDDVPHAWIQWKGTSVCMDVNCGCGCSSHICQESFVYYVKCPECSKIYFCNGHIELIEIKNISAEQNCIVEGELD